MIALSADRLLVVPDTNADIFDPLEKALASGTLDPQTLLAGGTPPPCHVGTRNATYFGGDDGGKWWPAQTYGAQFGHHVRTDEDGECAWSIHHTNASCVGNTSCEIPRFIKATSTYMTAMTEDEAPAELSQVEFPTTKPNGPYDVLTTPPVGGCKDTPGPASSKLYCVRSSNPSWVAFRW